MAKKLGRNDKCHYKDPQEKGRKPEDIFNENAPQLHGLFGQGEKCTLGSG
ncbi:MAG: hypothetical protein U5L00_07830 [Desulfovermiculus sp.]|nr:hypothetical protein [Desulfovermiculus sp.]